MPLQFPDHEYPIDAASNRRVRVHQLEHGPARRFHQNATGPDDGAFAAWTTGEQAHLAEKLAALEAGRYRRRILGVQGHFTAGDGKERRAELARLVQRVAFLDQPRYPRPPRSVREFRQQRVHLRPSLGQFAAGRIGNDDFALDEQLAKCQCIELAKHRHDCLEAIQQLVRVALKGQADQLRLQQRIVRGLDLVAVDELGDVVALIHGLLDQWVAGERPDDEDPGNVALVAARQRRNRVALGTGKLDSDRLHEAARRIGTEPGDDAMALLSLWPGWGLERDRPGSWPLG